MVAKKSRRGLRNWLIQRITAVITGLYLLFVIAYLWAHQPMDFQQWSGLYNSFLMKLITVIVLLALLWHTWLGLWTVLTDYVKSRGWRFVLQSLVILLLLGYLFWGLKILV